MELSINDLGDSLGDPIDYSTINGTVTVNPVPEPATLALMSSGLLGLMGFRRKFKKN